MTGVTLAMVRLLDEVPEPEDVRPGWFALIVVLTLVVVTVLLWRSMRTQLGRIDFDDSDEPADASGSGEAPGTATGTDSARTETTGEDGEHREA